MYSSENLHGESASADHEAAEKYHEKLKNIIEQDGYSEHQIFNADEAAVFWKKVSNTQRYKTRCLEVVLHPQQC